MKRMLLPALAILGFANLSCASIITFSGQITQSTSDGTGPAINNAELNNILDGDAYSVTVSFSGQILSTGTYDLTGGTLTFVDPTAAATEGAFGSISLTVSTDGSNYDISVLGCLSTGGGCSLGNQLDANFQIQATMLNALNVPATGLDEPHPLNLLEDDGATNIYGSIAHYSYINSNPVPEPSLMALAGCALAGLAIAKGIPVKWKRSQPESKKENDI